MGVILGIAVGLPAAVALLSVVLPVAGHWAARAAATASGTGLVLSAGLAVHVAREGAVTAVLTAPDGRVGLGLYADRLTIVLLLLVLGVGTVVQAFAGRYLRGDDRAVWFAASAGLLTTATAAMVTAATLVGLAAGWTVAGIALCLLLGTYRQLPAARLGVARTARAFLVGDAALWLAVVVATLQWGTLDLRRLGDVAPRLADDPTTLAIVACLLVVAAAARSAQLPFARWLPATLAAPTPVSALLHAGVVNAGGVLLVRTSPLFGASAVATYLAFALGAATTVYGTVLMLAKPDVKGALAHSTMGQMGFMIMTCGVGAYAAAVFHLVAHAMYKATLFLGSGSAVARHVRETKAPPAPALSAPARISGLALALFWPAAAIATAATLLYPASDDRAATALLVFAAASGAAASWGWLRRHPTPTGHAVALLAVALAAPGYVVLVHGFTTFVAPSIAAPATTAVSLWFLAAPLAVLVVAAALIGSKRAGRLGELHKTAYVLAISAGHVRDLARPGRRQPHATRSPASWLSPQPQGARP